MEMPVVEVRKHGVWLLAKNVSEAWIVLCWSMARIHCKCILVLPLFCIQVDQFIHRLLVEEDANNSPESNEELFHASADAGEKLYRKGDYAKSKISNLDVYLLKEVQKGSLNLYLTIVMNMVPKLFVKLVYLQISNLDNKFCYKKWFIFRLVYFQMS